MIWGGLGEIFNVGCFGINSSGSSSKFFVKILYDLWGRREIFYLGGFGVLFIW